MTNKLSLSTRIRYRFDSLMAAGTVAIILSLAGATFILVTAAAAIISLLRIDTGGDSSLVEAFWVSLLRAMDPGTMGADEGWGFRIVALIVTLGGIFIVSILIGLLTTGISQKLEDLRKGRTFVAEQGHTLILGWSTKLFALVSELVVANENQPKSCVVVMASQDKVMMEDEIRARVGRTGKTKIVCRTGNPAHTSDLEIANPLQAKSIIILSPDEEAPDAHVIKAVLALMSRDPNLQTVSTVAEFSDSRNARALQTLTLSRVQSVVSSEVIARMTAQVVRQPGLSAVFVELLDFNGVEVYFNRHDSINDRPFGDAVQMFENCSVIGLRSADGTIRLNPPMDEICKPDDALVVIAEDDVPLVPTVHGHPLAESSSTSQPPHTERPDRVLVVGWSSLGPTFLRFLDNCVVPESIAHIIYDPALVDPEELKFPKLQNIAIESTEADTMEPVKLAEVLVSESFDHVVLLCYRHSMSPMEADARTLMTLLQLRQLLEKDAGGRNINIVTELLDVNDVELARIANVDDFIVSERLTSLMLAQLAENPELEFVFQDLFHASGSSEISLRRVEEYFDGNGEATWARIVARGVERGESAIGYRKGKEGTDIQLNPLKSEAVRLSPTDQLIVVASSMGPQPSHRYNRSGGVA